MGDGIVLREEDVELKEKYVEDPEWC